MHEYKKDLVEYRVRTAKEKLSSAKILLDMGNYKDSVGRSYYGMFTIVRALLALDEIDFAKHAGVISYFQKEYVKTGKIDKKYSKYLSATFQLRNNCDYADFFLVSQDEAQEEYQKAEEFIEIIEQVILEEIKKRC